MSKLTTIEVDLETLRRGLDWAVASYNKAMCQAEDASIMLRVELEEAEMFLEELAERTAGLENDNGFTAEVRKVVDSASWAATEVQLEFEYSGDGLSVVTAVGLLVLSASDLIAAQ